LPWEFTLFGKNSDSLPRQYKALNAKEATNRAGAEKHAEADISVKFAFIISSY